MRILKVFHTAPVSLDIYAFFVNLVEVSGEIDLRHVPSHFFRQWRAGRKIIMVTSNHSKRFSGQCQSIKGFWINTSYCEKRGKIGVKSSFLTYIFAFLIYQSFFSTSYLFLSFVLHVCRTVILRIPLCRTANRFSLISCRYINAMKSALPSKVELTTCSSGLSYS